MRLNECLFNYRAILCAIDESMARACVSSNFTVNGRFDETDNNKNNKSAHVQFATILKYHMPLFGIACGLSCSLLAV